MNEINNALAEYWRMYGWHRPRKLPRSTPVEFHGKILRQTHSKGCRIAGHIWMTVEPGWWFCHGCGAEWNGPQPDFEFKSESVRRKNWVRDHERFLSRKAAHDAS